MLFVIISIYKPIIHHMDFEIAFLIGELEKKIYIEQPEGCVVLGQEQEVCELVKFLYGLKQAPIQ